MKLSNLVQNPILKEGSTPLSHAQELWPDAAKEFFKMIELADSVFDFEDYEGAEGEFLMWINYEDNKFGGWFGIAIESWSGQYFIGAHKQVKGKGLSSFKKDLREFKNRTDNYIRFLEDYFETTPEKLFR